MNDLAAPRHQLVATRTIRADLREAREDKGALENQYSKDNHDLDNLMKEFERLRERIRNQEAQVALSRSRLHRAIRHVAELELEEAGGGH